MWANRNANNVGDDDEFTYGNGAIAAQPYSAQEGENWAQYQKSGQVITRPTLDQFVKAEQLDAISDKITVTDESGDSADLTPAELLLVLLTVGSILYFNDDGTISAAVTSIVDTVNSLFGK